MSSHIAQAQVVPIPLRPASEQATSERETGAEAVHTSWENQQSEEDSIATDRQWKPLPPPPSDFWYGHQYAATPYALSDVEASALVGQDANAALRMAPSPVVGVPENAARAWKAEETAQRIFTLDGNGRAALIGDSTRMASFAKGRFLPAAIPVEGQPFFGSGDRVLLQGSGSSVGLNLTPIPVAGSEVSGFANVLVSDANLPTTDASNGSTFVVQQAFAQYRRFVVGLSETAFADPSAVPETMDVAGPSARVTVQPAGLGDTQGRMSCFFLTQSGPGFYGTLSMEQPSPQISTSTTTGTFARYPDFISTLKYSNGISTRDGGYVETGHVQFGSLFRSLGLESAANTDSQTVFGWGLSLSGARWFEPMNGLVARDGMFFSVTYGEGIARYITDLNASPDAADAVVDTSGLLTPLPVLAWYVGYTHNWTDRIRSTATFSQVNLDSVAPQAVGPSPYRVGDYVAANLVYHTVSYNPLSQTKYNVVTGIEYLFGHKAVLDGASGDAHRVMWVAVITGGKK